MFVHFRKSNKPFIVVGGLLAAISLISSLTGCSLLTSESDAESVTHVCPEGTVNLIEDASQAPMCVLKENEAAARDKLKDKQPARVGVVLEPAIVQPAAPSPEVAPEPKIPAASNLIASDLCKNFDGVQTTLPAGLISIQSSDGTWTCADPAWEGNGIGHIDPPEGGCAVVTPLPAITGSDTGHPSDASYDLSNGVPSCKIVPFDRAKHGYK